MKNQKPNPASSQKSEDFLKQKNSQKTTPLARKDLEFNKDRMIRDKKEKY